MRTLLIDNYDSYTFNLYQLLRTWYQSKYKDPENHILVIRNDQVTRNQLLELVKSFSNVIISPGPGSPDNPNDVGICRYLFENEISVPVLGVCLGFQLLGLTFGMRIKKCKRPYHGILSQIQVEDDSCLFQNIPSSFTAVRYHSLCLDDRSLNKSIICSAYANMGNDRVLMAIRHCNKPFYGVQFHPESICSEFGINIIENFFKISHSYSDSIVSTSFKVHDIVPKASNTRFVDSTAMAKQQFYRICLRSRCLTTSVQLFESVKSLTGTGIWLDSSKASQNSNFIVVGCSKQQKTIWHHVSERSVNFDIKGENPQTYTFSGSENIFSVLRDYLKSYEIIETVFSDCEPVAQAFDYLNFDFDCGLYGYVGYDCKHECDLFKDFKYRGTKSSVPDSCFSFLDRIIVYDLSLKYIYLIALNSNSEAIEDKEFFSKVLTNINTYQEPLTLSSIVPSNISTLEIHGKYVEAVKQCKKYIVEGESYELCLTTNLGFNIRPEYPSAVDAYKIIRSRNPAPYGAFLSFKIKDTLVHLLSSSPERFIKISREGEVSMKPIKGTVKRSIDPETDRINKERLKGVKEFAENLMIVDLIRNDLNLFCDNVRVTRLMSIETYETVHQLVSEVCGEVRDWNSTGNDSRPDPLFVLENCFPPGSMTGAPKLRSCEILETIESSLSQNQERHARGMYSGIQGFIGLNRASEFSVIIRSGVIVDNQDGKGASISVGAGGAVTYLSNEEEEYEEMMLKANSILPSLKEIYTEFLNS